MWSAIPVALLCIMVNWSERKQGSSPERADEWTIKSPPVFYRTLSPSASSHSNSQSCKAGQRVSLTTYCPRATCSINMQNTLLARICTTYITTSFKNLFVRNGTADHPTFFRLFVSESWIHRWFLSLPFI